MSDDIVLVNKRADGLAEVTMNRPEIFNALNAALQARLTEVFLALGADDEVRYITLTGAGKHFCAGGDIGYLRDAGQMSVAENQADAEKLARMLNTIFTCPKPVIGLINGAAYGGGLGMTTVCDIAIGVEAASFTLSEVKLGLIPGTIAPYVVQAMGVRQARRWFVTAERIDAHKAREIGLLHEVVADHPALLAERDRLIGLMQKNGPVAMQDSKALVLAVYNRPVDADVMADSARRIAESRAKPEGQEGTTAFLDKRPAAWAPQE
ncbi:MAG: enoyl-CoA hydratase/isomerase family protein [Alphaproteobacteria bacterium]|nr:enoyl-CoA hydratase/isomerase family protein [Alphaproteobacteria bacterium]MBL6954887.1 enoyl-CoA hydratase/isomerase family protein [Alphaproteobacteria bacterium]